MLLTQVGKLRLQTVDVTPRRTQQAMQWGISPALAGFQTPALALWSWNGAQNLTDELNYSLA